MKTTAEMPFDPPQAVNEPQEYEDETSDSPLPAMLAWTFAGLICWAVFGWAVGRIWA